MHLMGCYKKKPPTTLSPLGWELRRGRCVGMVATHSLLPFSGASLPRCPTPRRQRPWGHILGRFLLKSLKLFFIENPKWALPPPLPREARRLGLSFLYIVATLGDIFFGTIVIVCCKFFFHLSPPGVKARRPDIYFFRFFSPDGWVHRFFFLGHLLQGVIGDCVCVHLCVCPMFFGSIPAARSVRCVSLLVRGGGN